MQATALTCIAAAFVVGLAFGQEPQTEQEQRSEELQEKLAEVRREVKVVKLESSLDRLPAIVARENQYQKLLQQMMTAANAEALKPLLAQGRESKLALLGDLNEILHLHRGKFVDITEQEVWERLKNARFADVNIQDEWLVNVLDDIEESAQINIEVDARVYKYDKVSFQFDKTSARALLQMMGDVLLFNWIVRGDTLYVYKERHEVLFGGDWIKQKKAAWKARREALAAAAKEAERRALEEGGDEPPTGEGGDK